MSPTLPAARRAYTLGEDIAHIATHGVGTALSVAALVSMLVIASIHDSAWQIASAAVFGSTLVALYAISTAYHALSRTRARNLFHMLDQLAIYFLIVGTYTPFVLVCLRGPLGWTVLALVWALATTGIVLRLAWPRLGKRLAVPLYLCIGWLGLIAIRPLINALPGTALALLLSGGLAYTAGLIFYRWAALPYHHAIWHLFTLAGSGAHFAVVFAYVLTPTITT